MCGLNKVFISVAIPNRTECRILTVTVMITGRAPRINGRTYDSEPLPYRDGTVIGEDDAAMAGTNWIIIQFVPAERTLITPSLPYNFSLMSYITHTPAILRSAGAPHVTKRDRVIGHPSFAIMSCRSLKFSTALVAGLHRRRTPRRSAWCVAA